jgi:hypothetical protein
VHIQPIFNVKRARSGHLFQGRYKAILVDITDLSGQKTKNLTSTGSHSISNIIATTHDLLNVRKIVDALLGKLNASKQEFKKASTEKSKRVTGTFSQIKKVVPASADFQGPNLPAAKKRHNRPGQPDQQNGLYTEHKSESGAMP